MRRRMGRPGLVGTMARTAVIAGTATAVSGSIQKKQQAGAAQAQAAAEQQRPRRPRHPRHPRRPQPCRRMPHRPPGPET